MKVDRVTATIRYSKDENNAWKSLELGAEASIGPEDDWQISQALLYVQLAEQLKSLWSANGHKPSENGLHGAEKAVETPAREHWCPVHQVEFRRFEKDSRVWYSHRAKEGWCKEQPSRETTGAKVN
jgi:hypothetical protein